MAYKVIDVSEFQGNINWRKVRADGVVGVIIRYGDGTYKDPKFNTNVANAIAAGLHVGAYIFSRATNVAMAVAEADRIINACAGFNLTMPIYIDMEWSGQAKVANSIARAFLNRCDERGVKGGIYANLNWFNNYINANDFASYPLWIAQYYNRMTHKQPKLFGMWQYSSKGRVNGISGNVDMNECYVEYWKTVRPQAAPTSINYTVGKNYTLQDEMRVRTGPGTSYRAKSHNELTTDGKRHDGDRDGALGKGTKVTCLEVKYTGNDIWIKCPSGWIAAFYNGTQFVK